MFIAQTSQHQHSHGIKNGVIEKVGSVGALLAALAFPACFPMLAVVGNTGTNV
jgi:hypothetical protein